MWFKKNILKDLRKSYNGSVHRFNPPKPAVKRSIEAICNTACLPQGVNPDQVIRDIRKK